MLSVIYIYICHAVLKINFLILSPTNLPSYLFISGAFQRAEEVDLLQFEGICFSFSRLLNKGSYEVKLFLNRAII